jgi:hypothetical protein
MMPLISDIDSTDLLAVERYLLWPSAITDHGGDNCQAAKAWLAALDKSRSARHGQWLPPSWLRDRFEWGPIQWPLAWCQVPRARTLDCGALAAVAAHLFEARGRRVFRVQLAATYPAEATDGWRRAWDAVDSDPGWVVGKLCYHEAVGVEQTNESGNTETVVQVWDPTACVWLDPDWTGTSGFAATVSIRFTASRTGAPDPDRLRWGTHELTPGAWKRL